MFIDCLALKNINVKKFDIPGDIMKKVFEGCSEKLIQKMIEQNLNKNLNNNLNNEH